MINLTQEEISNVGGAGEDKYMYTCRCEWSINLVFTTARGNKRMWAHCDYETLINAECNLACGTIGADAKIERGDRC